MYTPASTCAVCPTRPPGACVLCVLELPVSPCDLCASSNNPPPFHRRLISTCLPTRLPPTYTAAITARTAPRPSTYPTARPASPCLWLCRRRHPVRQHLARPTRNASYTTARQPIGEQLLVVIVARGEYEGPALSLCVWALWSLSAAAIKRRLGLRFFEKLPKRSASIFRYCGCAQSFSRSPSCLLPAANDLFFSLPRSAQNWPCKASKVRSKVEPAGLYVPDTLIAIPIHPSISPASAVRDSTLLRSKAL